MVALPLGDVIDFAKERTRLEKDLKKAREEIARFDAKLSNEQFVSKAPEDVLTEQREKRAEAANAGAAFDERHRPPRLITFIPARLQTGRKPWVADR